MGSITRLCINLTPSQLMVGGWKPIDPQPGAFPTNRLGLNTQYLARGIPGHYHTTYFHTVTKSNLKRYTISCEAIEVYWIILPYNLSSPPLPLPLRLNEPFHKLQTFFHGQFRMIPLLKSGDLGTRWPSNFVDSPDNQHRDNPANHWDNPASDHVGSTGRTLLMKMTIQGITGTI